MNARGTRRPHSRRVRSKPVKIKRGSGGGGEKGCPLSFSALPAGLARGLLAEWQIRLLPR